MHSLAATTSDTIRVWDFDVFSPSEPPARATAALCNARRRLSGFAESVPGTEPINVTLANSYDVNKVENATSVSWSLDGASFVVGGKGAALKQYNRGGVLLQDISCESSPMDIVAMQHYGASSESLFIADNSTKQVRRWNFVKKELTDNYLAHENPISCMTVCARKRVLATATAQGGEISLFNMIYNTRSDLRSATHKSLTAIALSSGIRLQLAAGSEDGLLQLFDTTRSGTSPLKTYAQVHSAPIRGIAFHLINNSSVVSAGLDGQIVITDTNIYSSKSKKSALAISVNSPLTCLTHCSDPFILGAGTIDGDALLYDIRKTDGPLWRDSVCAHRVITDVCLVNRKSNADVGSEIGSLKRPASQRSDSWMSGFASSRKRYGLSDEIATSRPDRYQRIGGLGIRDGKPPSRVSGRPPVSLTSTAVASLNGSIPLQHPNTEKLRFQNNGAAPSTNTGEAIGENMAQILMKDRSYMDLLSPTKEDIPAITKGSAGYISPVREEEEEEEDGNILDMLSREENDTPFVSQDRRKSQPKAPDNVNNSSRRSSFDSFLLSPKLNPQQPKLSSDKQNNEYSSHQLQPPSSRDAGDSMMEIFTPERKQIGTLLPTADSQYNGKENICNGDSTPCNYSSSSRVQTLVSQLLSRSNEKLSPAKTPTTKGHGRHQLPPTIKSPVGVIDSPLTAKFLQKRQHLYTPKKHHMPPVTTRDIERTNLEEKRPSQDKPISATAKPATVYNGAIKSSSNSHPNPKTQSPEPAVGNIASTTPVETSDTAPSTATGLGSLSSSVLQNLLTDSLAPLREQLRGEIRNLHVDIIRQGFMQQEQIKTLRQECNESRQLRQEIERLRRENEELKHYVPFYSAPPKNHRHDR